jgi:hypothetical protein
MRIRSKDPMVLVTAPVPTLESGVRITQVGGNDGGDSDIDTDDDVNDFNDTDIDDDDFGDAYNDTESDRVGSSEPRLSPPPPWVHQRVVIDKVGNGTIPGNVQGVFDWPLLGTRPLPHSTRFDLFSPSAHARPHTHTHTTVTYGSNITDNLQVTGGEQSLVLVERLLGDELDFNGDGGVAPKELSRVFAFSFFEAPQSSVYRWSFNLGVDNITL